MWQFGVNGEAGDALSLGRPGGVSRGYNIAYPAWGARPFIEAWAQVLSRFDEITSPSQTCG
jgi:hypothetical protein